MSALIAVAGRLDAAPTAESCGVHVSWPPDQPGSWNVTLSPYQLPTIQLERSTAIHEFSQGLDDKRPGTSVVDLAHRLVRAAEDYTSEPEITVDVDGALSFDLRLKAGLLMFAELGVDGTLDISVLDDSEHETRVVRHLPAATESQFIEQL